VAGFSELLMAVGVARALGLPESQVRALRIRAAVIGPASLDLAPREYLSCAGLKASEAHFARVARDGEVAVLAAHAQVMAARKGESVEAMGERLVAERDRRDACSRTHAPRVGVEADPAAVAARIEVCLRQGPAASPASAPLPR
jgi:hypothetical protein